MFGYFLILFQHSTVLTLVWYHYRLAYSTLVICMLVQQKFSFWQSPLDLDLHFTLIHTQPSVLMQCQWIRCYRVVLWNLWFTIAFAVILPATFPLLHILPFPHNLSFSAFLYLTIFCLSLIRN